MPPPSRCGRRASRSSAMCSASTWDSSTGRSPGSGTSCWGSRWCCSSGAGCFGGGGIAGRPPRPTRPSGGPGLLHHHDGGAADGTLSHAVERLVRLIEGEGFDVCSHWHLRGDLEEVQAVLPGHIGHRTDRTLAPQDVVGEGGDVA